MRLSILTLVLFWAAVLLLAGCGGGGGTPAASSGNSTNGTLSMLPNGNLTETTADSIVLQPNVKQLPDNGLLRVADVSDNSVTLTGDVPALSAGDVIIKNAGDVQFLRKVAGVTTTTDAGGVKTVVIQTGKAGLQDVFKEANVDQTIHIGSEQLQTVEINLPGVTSDAPVVTKWRDGKPAKVSKTFRFTNTPLSGPNGSVTLNGSLTLSIDLALAAQIDLTGVHYFKIEPFIDADAELTATANFTGQCDLHIPITPQIPLSASLGILPLGPYLQFNTEIHGRVDASAAAGVHGHIHGGAGIEFDGTNWNVPREFTPSYDVTPPHITSAKGELDLTMLQPELGFSILGMGGTYVRFDIIRVDYTFQRKTGTRPGYLISPFIEGNIYAGAWINLGVGPLSLFHHEGQLPTVHLGKSPLSTSFIDDPPPPPFPKALNVFSSSGGTTVQYGQNTTLRAALTLSDGTSTSVGDPDVTWVADDPNVIDVSPDGAICNLVLNQPGFTVIRATHNASGLQSTIRLKLDVPHITALEVAPRDTTLGSSPRVQSFSKLPVTVTATYNDGSVADVTNSVAYSTVPSDPDRIGVSAAGTVTPYGEGTYKIVATASGGTQQVTGSMSLQVTSPSVSRVTTSPGSSTSAVVGRPVQYRAFGAVQDGSTRDLTDRVLWLTSDSRVADVDQHGLVTPKSKGLATIVADDTHGTQFTGSQMLVGAGRMTSLLVTGPTHVNVGDSIDLTATAVFEDGTRTDLTRVVKWVAWNQVATRINDQGRVFGLARGSTYVVATYAGQQNQYAVFVDDAVALGFIDSYPTAMRLGESFGCSVAFIDVNHQIQPISGEVTLELVDGGDAHLLGTTTVTASAGIATFSGLSLDRAASSAKIRARASRMTSAVGPVLAVSAHAGNGLLFVSSIQSDRISSFAVDNVTGTMTAKSVTATAAGAGPTALVATRNDPHNPFVYCVNQLGNTVDAYQVDTTSGGLTFRGSVSTGIGRQSLDLALYNDSAIFVANKATNDVALVAIDDNDRGTLFYGGSFAAGTNPVAVRFLKCNGARDLLFVANFGSNDITVFAWDEAAGVLQEVPGSPFANQPGCSGPRSLAVGRLNAAGTSFGLFATNQTSQNVAAWSIDASPASPQFGTLSPSGSVSVGVTVKGVAFADGNYVYANGSNGIYGYSADPVNAALSPLVNGILGVTGALGSPERSTFGVTAEGTRCLFLTNFSTTPGSSSVSAFTVDASGFLAPAGTPATTADGASGVVFLQT